MNKENAQGSSIVGRKLSIKKGKKPILFELDFTVRRGSVTGLIGPSGSGKTTLMRAIVGVQKYSGVLKVAGVEAGRRGLRSKIGYVTQAPAIYTDLTVLQNLRYFGQLVGATKDDIESVLRQVSLTPQKSQRVDSLSGGQKARVSLAVALLGQAEILVLDEPTVGLDPILRMNLWRLFHQLAKEGKTLLVSSHVMDEADRCDDLLLLRDGKLLWNDSRVKLLSETKTKQVNDAFLKMVEAK